MFLLVKKKSKKKISKKRKLKIIVSLNQIKLINT